jgi:eukaryotic-like serine/threonine-protein kinase
VLVRRRRPGCIAWEALGYAGLMDATGQKRTIGGRYRLDRSIGAGGMGTVWEGYDELLGRPVAVKEVRFPRELGDREVADLRERTMREARATARLSHPNVVTTYDVVEEDHRPWIVMELLASRSLAQTLREDGPLPPARVAQVGLDMLGALESSHGQGVVHRDVKPSNVLIAPDGRAVLTDFGIASTAGDPALTSTGMVLGSPAFMSPERARGLPFGPQSDLWSLGATLFAAAEGKPPFETDSALGTLTSVIADPVPALSAGGPLAEAVEGLLRKDPADRAGIAETREGLLRATAERAAPVPTTLRAPVAAYGPDQGRTQVVDAAALGSPSTAEPSYDERRRRRGLLIAALVLAALVLGVLVALAIRAANDGSPAATPPAKHPSTPSTTASRPTRSSPPPSTSAPANGLPAGFHTYTDPTGFSVGVPDGWTAAPSSATAVDFKDPDSSAFLRIDRTDQPKGDPKKDWEQQEKSVRKTLPGYHRISIESVDYRGWRAADWEFTFGTTSLTHVLDRGFVTDPAHGYAIYLSTPDTEWDADQQAFQVAADSFMPAGGSSGGDQGDQGDQGD